jgi:hypothetical protein
MFFPYRSHVTVKTLLLLLRLQGYGACKAATEMIVSNKRDTAATPLRQVTTLH